MSELIVTEIFYSVQGESSWAGMPCAFVRLTGCPLRCRWCDTVYGFHGGKKQSIDSVLETLATYPTRLVEVTGGEPLAQAAAVPLMQRLIDEGYTVLLETSGSQSLAEVPKDVRIIMDLKCPGSGMDSKNLWSNLDLLKSTDEIKFVVASREDFEWAVQKIREHDLAKRAHLLLSPAWGLVKPQDLVAWLLESGIPARLNLQLHKLIWGPKKKGV